jgi:O-antigen/teichoic acid export membrane protein
MRNILRKVALCAYEVIFHNKASDAVENFIDHLCYLTFGFGAAYVFGFAFQILAGRILGPVEYGKYALVQSIAMFLYIPMNLGVTTALIKYNAEKNDPERQRKIISTSFLMILLSSIISTAVLFFMIKPLSKIFDVSFELFALSVTFALFYNLFLSATSILRSIHEMRKLSIFQSFYGFFTLFFLCTFLFVRYLNFETLVYASCASYFIIFILTMASVRELIVFRVDKVWFRKLMKYALYGIIGGIAGAFYLSFNKILISHYLAMREVGIYSAYYASFVTLPTFFLSVFNTVFFPTASRYANKENIFKKINKLMLYLVGLGIPLVTVLGFVTLGLYGRSYRMDFALGITFALSGLLIFIDSIYGWLMNAVGDKGVRVTSFGATILAIVSTALNILLIPRIGLFGAVFSTIIGYMVSIAIVISQKKYYKLEEVTVC